MENIKDWVENDKTMVIFKADENEMRSMMNTFHLIGKKYAGFHEPDICNVLTAVAFEPMEETEGDKLFWNCKLL